MAAARVAARRGQAGGRGAVKILSLSFTREEIKVSGGAGASAPGGSHAGS